MVGSGVPVTGQCSCVPPPSVVSTAVVRFARFMCAGTENRKITHQTLNFYIYFFNILKKTQNLFYFLLIFLIQN